MLLEIYPCKLDIAVSLAALQMQITYGNYDALVHVAGFMEYVAVDIIAFLGCVTVFMFYVIVLIL